MSIDALAMAGVDYTEIGINFKEMEFREESIPKYLIAENELSHKKDDKKRVMATKFHPGKQQISAKLYPWKKASTSKISG
ncbi:hypothetical protein SOVF_116890 [Spinacia oleracea]|nr:hypothetical protein SOVF_116890 [Spinacia oleracea]